MQDSTVLSPPALRFSSENTSVSQVAIPIAGNGPLLVGYLNRMPHAGVLDEGKCGEKSGIASRL